MSVYFQPEELRVVLDQLARDPYTEEVRNRRFRETYSPFSPARHDPRGYRELSETTATPHSAKKPTPLPSAASDQQPSTPYPVGAGSSDENRALATYNVEQIGQIGVLERISHWRRSSCHWPFPNAPVAEGTRYAASVDQLEILTEIATSYSGSTQGDCIHVNGDIEIHGSRVSPVSQQTALKTSVKRTKSTKASKDKLPTKKDKQSRLGQPAEGTQPVNNKDFFFGKRRRSERIAALTRVGK